MKIPLWLALLDDNTQDDTDVFVSVVVDIKEFQLNVKSLLSKTLILNTRLNKTLSIKTVQSLTKER